MPSSIESPKYTVTKVAVDMPSPTSRNICVALFLSIALMPLLCQSGSAKELSLTTTPLRGSPLKIAQTPDADRQRQLQQQRESERVLQQGERLKREVRENNYYNNYNNRDLDRQVGDQINRVRESGSNPQTVREADIQLNRLRQQNLPRPNYYYDPFYYPYYYSTPPIIFTPNYGGIYPRYRVPVITPRSTELDRTPIGQDDGTSGASQDNRSRRSNNQILGSVGFKDGNISPSIGVRYNTLGFEIGGIFNQDSLPGRVNEFSLPGNFLFNDLGVKKLSPQWGGDLLGFVDVAPRVAVYGSVGIYFQNVARIAQSQATNDLYKQTDDTNVTGAVGGGVTYSPSDDISIGLGYHSLRGLTTRLGISF
jgi:opacity protein-like surface antigen